MHTRIIPVEDAIEDALMVLDSHLPVAVPTETVYGLAARYDDEKAVKAIFAIKGRPHNNPIIVHIENNSQLQENVKEIPEYAKKLMKYWPGPLTMVLKSKKDIPWTTAELPTIAVRIPSNNFLRALIKRAGPLAAPSANLSGKPSPTTAQHCFEDLQGKIPLIIDGGSTEHGLESTVVDCTGSEPRILRPGAITAEEIGATIAQDKEGKSPGTKHKHYKPEAKVVIADNLKKNIEKAKPPVMTISRKSTGAENERVYENPHELAKNLYQWLREADAIGIKTVIVEPINEEGIGAAVMDRLRRAAE